MAMSIGESLVIFEVQNSGRFLSFCKTKYAMMIVEFIFMLFWSYPVLFIKTIFVIWILYLSVSTFCNNISSLITQLPDADKCLAGRLLPCICHPRIGKPSHRSVTNHHLSSPFLTIFQHLTKRHVHHEAVLGRLPGTTLYRNVEQYPEAYTYNGIVIVRVDAPLYFANISYVKERWMSDTLHI